MSRRIERAPTAEDSKPELYDERPGATAEEPPPGIFDRWRLRKAGWRKDPHGNGFHCPEASCKTGGDLHTRFHHDNWHQWLNGQLKSNEEAHQERDRAREDRDAQVDAVTQELSNDVADLQAQMRVLVQLHQVQHAQDHEPPPGGSNGS